VLLVPAHTAPNKSHGAHGGQATSPEHRLAMCRLAVKGHDGLSVCAIELERGGVSYTVDTLTALHVSHPSAELTLIVGADVASTLGSWREPQRLLTLARLAVAGRPDAAQAPALDATLVDPRRVRFLALAPIAVSSSAVRQRVQRGEPIDDLVGADVAEYIAAHGLYRGERADSQSRRVSLQARPA